MLIDHTKPLQPQIEALIEDKGIGQVTHIASLNGTESYFESYTELLAPFGKIAMIDDPGQAPGCDEAETKEPVATHRVYVCTFHVQCGRYG